MQGKTQGRLGHKRDDRLLVSATITLDSNGTAASTIVGSGVTKVTQSSTGIFYATLDDLYPACEGAYVCAGTAGTAAPPGFAALGKVDLPSKKVWFFTAANTAPQTPAAQANLIVNLQLLLRNTSNTR